MDCGTIFHIVNSIICVFGFIGNILIIIVLVQPVMRNSFNILLIGLSLCDSLLLAIIFLQLWPVLEDKLNQHYYYFQYFAQTGSIYFTITISLERLVAVSYPLHARRILTNKNSKLLVVTVLIFSGLLSVLVYLLVEGEHSDSLVFLNLIVRIGLPFITLLIINVFIYSKVRRAYQAQALMTDFEKSEASTTRRLFYIVVVFLICYIPSTCYGTTWLIRRSFPHSAVVAGSILTFIESCLLDNLGYALNSSLNFFIYFISGQKFRTTLKTVISSFLLKFKVCNRNAQVPEQWCELRQASITSVETNSTEIDCVDLRSQLDLFVINY